MSLSFRDRADAFNSVNAVVYCISVNTPSPRRPRPNRTASAFALLSHFNRMAVNAYGVALPNLVGIKGYVAYQRAVFIVDGEGFIRYKRVGESPLNEPDYDEVQQAAASLG